jgi:Domain of unknown function (DUF4190)
MSYQPPSDRFTTRRQVSPYASGQPVPSSQNLPATRPLYPSVPQSRVQQTSPPAPVTQQPIIVVPAQPSSGPAVWALVLGLVGLLFGWCMLGLPCVAAVIVGHVAIADTKNDQKTGRGMAVAGLALGYISLAPALFLFLWLVLGAGMALVPGVDPTVTPTP